MELQYADAQQNLMLSLDSHERDRTVPLRAFGEVVDAVGQADHRWQFNGKEHDTSTGLSYYGARYYDPVALQWNSADPLYSVAPGAGLDQPQRLNLYAFSINNPLRYYDSQGLEGEGDPSGETATEAPNEDDDQAFAVCTAETDQCPESDLPENLLLLATRG